MTYVHLSICKHNAFLCTPCPGDIDPLDPLLNFTPFSGIERHAHLTTKDELEDPHDEHPGDAHQEGEDGGQEEAPPFPLPQTFLRVIMLKQIPINLSYFYFCRFIVLD